MDGRAEQIVRLHAERRALRAEGVPPDALARNERALVAAHRELVGALLARQAA
ncbi:MAG: hypothetical protein ACM33B_04915 [Pseudomonadota bacterium]